MTSERGPPLEIKDMLEPKPSEIQVLSSRIDRIEMKPAKYPLQFVTFLLIPMAIIYRECREQTKFSNGINIRNAKTGKRKKRPGPGLQKLLPVL